ncbi:MAG TPA: hypothetical protein VGK88_13905 [bacterium]
MAKPIVDRLISMVSDRIDVRRINVLSSAGQDLAWRLQVDMVPLVLLYDQSGQERYRASGFRVRAGLVSRMIDGMLAGSEVAR